MKTHSNVDFYLYGHRHIELDLMLSRKTRMIILGDWIWQFTYAVFDGEHMFLEQYVEGESQPWNLSDSDMENPFKRFYTIWKDFIISIYW